MLYDYLRRWWRLLVLAVVIGGTAALSYQVANVNPLDYRADVTVAIMDPAPPLQKPPVLVVNLIATELTSEEAAIATGRAMVAAMANYTNAPVVTEDFFVSHRPNLHGWWKDIILGSIFGTLLAIGWIYVWEDTKSYLRHTQQTP